MKVAHASDHITHAIIGGKAAVNFGISDDPAFFQILSKSLYKNPLLAMVREIICNAWDIHIECGITNKAIEVTLSDEYLIIKDYGIGIHDDLIAPVYGIYGASTKKNDGRQTGGFGLGCKSPFAYNEHFEVTSAHNGIKTIYKMSRSSGELEGKPSITPIASFPSTETGITVKIPINPMDKMNHLIPWYVRNVVFNGDIKATLNQEPLPILGLDQTEFGLVMLTEYGDGDSRHIKDTISVRYGNVIYPVERTEHWNELYVKVENLLTNHYHCKLIILAPPDSISITPSRESLTNSDITVETINKLMMKFLSVFLKNQRLLFRHSELVNEYIDHSAKELEKPEVKLAHKLPLNRWTIPGIPQRIETHLLKSTEDFAKLEVLIRYGSNKKLTAKKFLGYIQRYLYKIRDAKPDTIDQGLLQHWARTFQRKMQNLRNPEDYDPRNYYEKMPHLLSPKEKLKRKAAQSEKSIATLWWQKKILYPLTKKLAAIPGFDRGRLYYVNRHHNQTDRWSNVAAIRVGSVRLNNHTSNLIHLMKPTVILCHTAELLPNRIRNIHTPSVGTEQANVYFVYEVSRKQEEMEAVLEAFKLIDGIELMDFCGRTPSEQADYDERQAKISQNKALLAAGKDPIIRVPKKVRNGMVRLDVIWDPVHEKVWTPRFTEDKDPVRIVKPEAVAQISTARDKELSIAGMGEKLSKKVAQLFGTVVGISNKSDAIAKVIKKDPTIMEIRPYLYDKIMHEVQNSPTLLAYRECNIEKVENYIRETVGWVRTEALIKFLKMLIDYPELNFLVPDMQILSYEDKMRWTLWEAMEDINYKERDNIRKVRSEIEAVPLKKELKEFLDKLIANPFLGAIDNDETTELMRRIHKDPIASQKFIELLTLILK